MSTFIRNKSRRYENPSPTPILPKKNLLSLYTAALYRRDLYVLDKT